MTTTYSQRLFLGPAPAAWAAIYTANHFTTIFRDLEFDNAGTGPTHFQLSVQASSGSPSAIWIDVAALAVATHTQWQGRIVLNQGDQLWGNANGGNVHLILSGYVFDS